MTGERNCATSDVTLGTTVQEPPDVTSDFSDCAAARCAGPEAAEPERAQFGWQRRREARREAAANRTAPPFPISTAKRRSCGAAGGPAQRAATIRPARLFLPLVFLSILALPAAAQTTTYVAFGDSITFGVGDDPARAEKGYPPRLEALLQSRGKTADVRNEGLPGETTAEGVTRITAALKPGDNVLLLLEGTNDVGKISVETTQFNLSEIARKAKAAGVTTVHSTLTPRLPSATNDGDNQLTEQVAVEVRELAFEEARDLADPFEVFFRYTADFTRLYVGGDDKVHPNALGYDLLAQVFADVLTATDKVPPVTGMIQPHMDAQGVAPGTPIRIDLYDFGTGIDLAATKLVINGAEVETPISGSDRKLEIRYEPPQPLAGVVRVAVRSRDRAAPANTLEREVTQFVMAGAQFLQGDIDRDGRVDGADLLVFAPRFGSRLGEARFRSFADLNNDDQVDGLDLALLAANFGKSST
jgi:lysophospholipase L1-like esterase